MSVKLLLIALCGFSVSASTKINRIIWIIGVNKVVFYCRHPFKAFMSCSKMGMNLWSIDSDEEFDKVHAEYMNDLMIWTSGAAKDVHQLHWMNTGNPVRLARWHPGEPNYGNEYCLHIWFTKGKFLLNHTNCKVESYFICESKKV